MANIIIVEDDANLAKVYQKKLVEGGHTVSIVEDASAVATIAAQKPSLVLCDIMMPRVNGLDILRELKADPNSALVPILLLTNVAEDASIAKGLELGAYGYLLKSETSPDQVLSRVNMTLEETAPAKP